MPLITMKDLIEAKAYEDERSALDDALRCLLRCRPELRQRVAVHQYRTGDVSLARAAYLAGVSCGRCGISSKTRVSRCGSAPRASKKPARRWPRCGATWDERQDIGPP
ncbi:MAG: hypothetical protein HY721_13760 [Planctomycetes bacterium]|nr:hypothetical protein [Planctomycetota bacterium]